MRCAKGPRKKKEGARRQARARFFRESGFAADGGYDEDWSDAEIGGLRYRVRNGPARRAALRLHDLHHVATGYGVDWRGEAEISAAIALIAQVVAELRGGP